MIALEHDPDSLPLPGSSWGSGGWAQPLDVFVNQLAVMQDADEPGIGDLLARRVEAWSLEPESGRTATARADGPPAHFGVS